MITNKGDILTMKNNIEEQRVSFENNGVILNGTMAIPDFIQEKYPAVLIIQGSGKLDRDGNVTKGKWKLQLYKQLAQYIASLGFITLRYDKRGVGESTGDYYSAGMWDLVNDARTAVQFLKKHPLVDETKILLLGHSEGCILAPAVNRLEAVNGMILLSGAGEKLDEALERQRSFAYKEVREFKGMKGLLVRAMKVEEKGEKKALAIYEKMKQTPNDVLKIQFQKINAKWFREHLNYDVLEDLAKVECPLIAMTGVKDFQADAEKLKRLPALVKGDLEYYPINDMDHGCKKHEGPINVLKYKKTYIENGNKPLHEDLCKYLAKWLETHFQTEPIIPEQIG